MTGMLEGLVDGPDDDALVRSTIADLVPLPTFEQGSDSALTTEQARAARYAGPCSVLALDRDGLKAVIDEQRHAAGRRGDHDRRRAAGGGLPRRGRCTGASAHGGPLPPDPSVTT